MQPLKGQRIVVTRPAHQAGSLLQLFTAEGAEVLLLPTVAIAPPLDLKPLKAAASRLGTYDWLILTSANALEALRSQLPPDYRIPPTLRVAAVGQLTAAAARHAGFHIALTPETFTADALTAALAPSLSPGHRILLPVGDLARDAVPAALRAYGALVHQPPAYRNVTPDEAGFAAPQIFQAPFPQWATFASPSAFEHLLPLVPAASLSSVRLASIGPATSAAITAAGFSVSAEASPHTAEGLVAAIVSSSGTATGG